MSTSLEIKKIVQDKYAQIATKESSCCGSSCECGAEPDYSTFNSDYTKVEGYMEDADLNLGCGLPTQFANIKNGDTVVDLGSGAGNDVFVARQITGESGKVVGIDMTPEMIERANLNNEKMGFENVEFKLGDIEELPLDDEMSNVVVSNCVLNLVPDKEKAFSEIYRVLKSGGHFCISDVVIEGEIPSILKESAEMYAGCVSGALPREEYLDIITSAGFKNVEVKKSREIVIPHDVLNTYLDENQYEKYVQSDLGIYSITVVATKN